MKKRTLRTITYFLVFALVMSFTTTLATNSPQNDSGARITRVEYQGIELSKDKNNPTKLDWTGDYASAISLTLVGNAKTTVLNNLDDVTIFFYMNSSNRGHGNTAFDSNGRATSYISVPAQMFVGNDIFEAYWKLFDMNDWRGSGDVSEEFTAYLESPRYFITFNQGEINHEVPRGDIPAIARAEYNGTELSKDKNNPTIIPYYNSIVLVGNSACISKTLTVQRWNNGQWTWGGSVITFSSVALGVDTVSVAYEFPGGNGKPLYNETFMLEFGIHNDNNPETATKSPEYYVVVLDEETSLVDVEANGLFHTVRLTGDQLIVEAKQGYLFVGSDLLLRDLTDNKEYSLRIYYDNESVNGVMTNRIVYSGLPLKTENIYKLTIPARSVLLTPKPNPGEYYNLKFNKEYSTELILAGALDFKDVKKEDWYCSYVNELTEKRIIDGYEDGTFKPNGHVTRSEFAKIMTLALQIPLVGASTATFIDLPKSNWAFDYVETVKSYLTGFYDGSSYVFKGSAPALREDMAVALVKAMGLENENVDMDRLTTVFRDYESISPNLRKYVLIAYDNNLIDGYPDSTFRAQLTITRAEATALLSKVTKSDAMEKVTFE